MAKDWLPFGIPLPMTYADAATFLSSEWSECCRSRSAVILWFLFGGCINVHRSIYLPVFCPVPYSQTSYGVASQSQKVFFTV